MGTMGFRKESHIRLGTLYRVFFVPKVDLGDGVSGPFTGLINFASILNMFNALDIKWRIDN